MGFFIFKVETQYVDVSGVIGEIPEVNTLPQTPLNPSSKYYLCHITMMTDDIIDMMTMGLWVSMEAY